MWLPKDERRLLAYYFVKIKAPGRTERFNYVELGKRLQSIFVKLLEWLGGDYAKNFKRFMNYSDRIKIANDALNQRGFIILIPHQHDSGVIIVELNVKGYDLGRKYSWWWTRTGLLFAEYRHHWIVVILSYIAGIITMLLVNLLTKGD